MKVPRTFVFVFAQWAGLGILSFFAIHIKHPLLFKVREWEMQWVCGGGLALLMWALFQIGTRGRYRQRSLERWGMIGCSLLVLFIATGNSLQFYFKKAVVLNAPEDQLRYLGKHFVVGYSDEKELHPLIKRGGIGGIFVTRRNVQHKTHASLRKEIQRLQTLQQTLQQRPLFVATDQEGGIVSRMSPLLTALPPLSSVLKGKPSPEELDTRVTQYATIHGRELAGLGINLNFGPVVDLQPEDIDGFGHSQIFWRAISRDPHQVAQVAQTYSQTLQGYGVFATLKHFPGLGAVEEDTHHFTGILPASREQLENREWVPFQQVAQSSDAFIMLGHVQLKAWDSKHLVPTSSKIVQEVLRQSWQYEGILITDDLNMTPSYSSPGGIGEYAIQALNAGVDLMLISYDGDQYYEAMYAVLRAYQQKRLNLQRLAASQERLERRIAMLQKSSSIEPISYR